MVRCCLGERVRASERVCCWGPLHTGGLSHGGAHTGGLTRGGPGAAPRGRREGGHGVGWGGQGRQAVHPGAVWRCPEGCGPWATAVMQCSRSQQLNCGAKGCKKQYSYSQCEIHSLHASLKAAKEHV
jgi:hypothetical protein